MQVYTKFQKELANILKNRNIRTVFQPIVSLIDGSILGYESLSRGPLNSILEEPQQLFQTAKTYQLLWDLELLCREKALENWGNMHNDHLLFFNVSSDIISNKKFSQKFVSDFLEKFNIGLQNIIFTITEQTCLADFKKLCIVLNEFFQKEYPSLKIDTSNSKETFQSLAKSSPHYLKIAMNLIRGLDKDHLKQSFIKTLQNFSVMTNIKIIAEGIETQEELTTLLDLGITYGQGYFLQRPSTGLLAISPKAKIVIQSHNEKKKRLYHSPTSIPVGDIAKKEMPVYPNSNGREIDQIFRANPSLQGIPVVANNKPIGLIMRNKFYLNMASQYGVVLFMGRPIKLLMDPNPLIIDYYTPLDQVSHLSVARKDDQMYDYIIITKDQTYFGITTIRDLLVNTTQLELNIAKHSNPLTGLPGNLIIEERLKNLVDKTTTPYFVVYVDLDNFKAYNDTYGFENGDKFLAYTASLLSENVADLDPDYGFVGHIGGDDFILIVYKDNAQSFCQKLINDFDTQKLRFFSEQDKNNGYIVTENRLGKIEHFPLITLSLAVITDKFQCKTIAQLSEKASELKHHCKLNNCSCCYIY